MGFIGLAMNTTYSVTFSLCAVVFGTVFMELYDQSYAEVLFKPATQSCSPTHTDMTSSFTLDGDQYAYCETYIKGPSQDYVISLNITVETGYGNQTTFLVEDFVTDKHHTVLYNATEDVTNLYSHSFIVRITFTQSKNEAATVILVTYTIHPLSDLSTTLTNKSGSIDVLENMYEAINYQYIWFIKTDENDNFIYFYIENITVNDASGDFVAIGTGSEVFADSPVLMFTGQWTKYPSVHISGKEAYVYVFMKTYSMNYAVDLYYDTSMYVPPTLHPPPTDPPLYILTATIQCDDCNMNYTVMITNFIDTMEKYALKYCKNDHLETQVTVTEVVEYKPCITIAFYVDLTNGTCHGNFSFTEEAYIYMIGNYSSEIEKDFGQEIFSQCPHNNTMWILDIVIVLVLSIFIIIFVGCRVHDSKNKRHNKMESSEDLGLAMHHREYDSVGDDVFWDGNIHMQRQSSTNLYVESQILSRSHHHVPKLTTDHLRQFNGGYSNTAFDYDEEEEEIEDDDGEISITENTQNLQLSNPPHKESFVISTSGSNSERTSNDSLPVRLPPAQQASITHQPSIPSKDQRRASDISFQMASSILNHIHDESGSSGGSTNDTEIELYEAINDPRTHL